MAKQKQSKSKGIVQPGIRVEGVKHPLESLFEKGEEPVMKSIGYMNLKAGNNWISYVITTKGSEVLSIEVDEPNLRAIAEETSKINFVHQFVDEEA